MGRLINIGPGEISDRLSILALKILFGTEAGKDCTHFATEHTALLSQIRSRTLNGKWFEKVLELAAVNSALWHSEDELRNMRSGYDATHTDKYPTPLAQEHLNFFHAATRVAFRIQSLNDRRAALVQQINEDAGESVQPEKL